MTGARRRRRRENPQQEYQAENFAIECHSFIAGNKVAGSREKDGLKDGYREGIHVDRSQAGTLSFQQLHWHEMLKE